MKSFQEMPLSEELQRALAKLKFIEPTEIQKAVIPIASSGQDLMACAETGSGKTGAYGIPMVTNLLENPQTTALVLAPTRELAHQISDFLRELTTFCRDIQVTALVGGADMRRQLTALKKRPRIIVATPGRLNDHLRRRSLKLDSCSNLVLDEGDRMLDMGFAPQLDEILKFLPEKRQTSLFTATLPKKVQKLAEQYLTKPKNIGVGRVSLPVASVKQSVIQVGFKEKDDRIVDELNKREGSVIVFTRTKNRTDILARNLKELGFAVDLIHGGRSQGQRNKALLNFRKGHSRILCATDVAARGIDIPQVEHVINFDLPMMSEDYVHRIGRTARNGATGEAVSFVTPQETRAWQALAREYKIPGVELEGVSRDRGRGKSGGSFKRSSYGDRRDRPSFGEKKRFSDKPGKPAFFERKKRSFDDAEKPPFGEKKRYSDSPDRPSFERKKRFGGESEKRPYGEKKSFSEKSERPSFGKKKRFDSNSERPSSFGEKKRFSDKIERTSYDKKKRFADESDRPSFEKKKRFAKDFEEPSFGKKKRFADESDRPSFSKKRRFADDSDKPSFGEKKRFSEDVPKSPFSKFGKGQKKTSKKKFVKPGSFPKKRIVKASRTQAQD